MIYVFFANGFEEVEAVATVDMLRRAELEVCIKISAEDKDPPG